MPNTPRAVSAARPEQRRAKAHPMQDRLGYEFRGECANAVANVTMPLWNALSPKPICSISGNRNGIAPVPNLENAPRTTVVRNSLRRNSLRSSSG